MSEPVYKTYTVVTSCYSFIQAQNEKLAEKIAEEIRAAITKAVDEPDMLVFEVETTSIYEDNDE